MCSGEVYKLLSVHKNFYTSHYAQRNPVMLNVHQVDFHFGDMKVMGIGWELYSTVESFREEIHFASMRWVREA